VIINQALTWNDHMSKIRQKYPKNLVSSVTLEKKLTSVCSD